MIQLARMMEQVDMQVLKTCGPKGPCGFNSHSEYKNSQVAELVSIAHYECK